MPRSLARSLAFSILSGTLALLLAAFQWTVIDVVTPFLMLPLQGVVALLLLIAAVWALIAVIRFRRSGFAAGLPLIVVGAVVLALAIVPWTYLWLRANEALYRTDRQAIVEKVRSGVLRPNVEYNPSLIALGPGYPAVSKGGNDIVLEEHDGRKYVFFYTFRGILDNYSGFLYVPDGGDPKLFADAFEASTRIDRRSTNWYFVAHW